MAFVSHVLCCLKCQCYEQRTHSEDWCGGEIVIQKLAVLHDPQVHGAVRIVNVRHDADGDEARTGQFGSVGGRTRHPDTVGVGGRQGSLELSLRHSPAAVLQVVARAVDGAVWRVRSGAHGLSRTLDCKLAKVSILEL